MKNLKIITILMLVLTISIVACSPSIANDQNHNDSVVPEENQPIIDDNPSDTKNNEGTANDTDEVNEVDPKITGTIWLWERFDDTANMNNIIVGDPSLYTLLLNEDGSYQIKADCNLSAGQYTIESSSISLSSGPTTLAECGPESLYNDFLSKLGYIGTYVFDGGNLVLNLFADGGNMVFSPSK